MDKSIHPTTGGLSPALAAHAYTFRVGLGLLEPQPPWKSDSEEFSFSAPFRFKKFPDGAAADRLLGYSLGAACFLLVRFSREAYCLGDCGPLFAPVAGLASSASVPQPGVSSHFPHNFFAGVLVLHRGDTRRVVQPAETPPLNSQSCSPGPCHI